jgi:hypothetical protein
MRLAAQQGVENGCGAKHVAVLRGPHAVLECRRFDNHGALGFGSEYRFTWHGGHEDESRENGAPHPASRQLAHRRPPIKAALFFPKKSGGRRQSSPLVNRFP